MTLTETPMNGFDGFKDIRPVRRNNLTCVAVRLKTGDLCLYSPVANLSPAFADAEPVRYLLAPNHYHNKAVQEFAKAYCDARLVCPDGARERLEKVTGYRFEGLDALEGDLPETVSLVAPDGLKTGEVWLRVRDGSRLAWIVTDAFCGPAQDPADGGKVGFLKTFPRYGIGDAGCFAAWVRRRLETEVPDLILPCHGAPVRSPDLKRDILALLETLG